jgi:hypothetical protein
MAQVYIITLFRFFILVNLTETHLLQILALQPLELALQPLELVLQPPELVLQPQELVLQPPELAMRIFTGLEQAFLKTNALFK